MPVTAGKEKVNRRERKGEEGEGGKQGWRWEQRKRQAQMIITQRSGHPTYKSERLQSRLSLIPFELEAELADGCAV